MRFTEAPNGGRTRSSPTTNFVSSLGTNWIKPEPATVFRAVWTGTLPPGRCVELPFMAVNPERETRITWPVVQTYGTTEAVEWAGPDDSDRPASVTEIRSPDDGTPVWVIPLAVIAAVMALVSLMVALSARRGAP